MILICPQCRAKSRVSDTRALAPGARVRCGGCQAVFLASDAKRDRARIDALTAAALARARQSSGRGAGLSGWQRVASPLALVALTALGVLAFIDPAPNVGPSADLRATVALAPAAPAATVVIQSIEATPYAATGGPEGLLIQGLVRNGGIAAVPLPIVLLRVAGAASSPRMARLRAGPGQTLGEAPTLAPLQDSDGAAQAGAATTLAPGAQAPFVGLLQPQHDDARSWQVEARL